MSHVLQRYIRTYRKRNSLTQKEIAFLLGLTSGDSVAKYERLERMPSFLVAIAYSVIFDEPLEELFPGEFKKIELLSIKRIRQLKIKLEQQATTKMNDHKKRLLSKMIKRVQRRTTKYENNS